jgi:hypothetical protein
MSQIEAVFQGPSFIFEQTQMNAALTLGEFPLIFPNRNGSNPILSVAIKSILNRFPSNPGTGAIPSRSCALSTRGDTRPTMDADW